MNTKISNKGYILIKKELKSKEIQKLRQELTVKPYVPKDFPQANSFVIYLESPKKIYIPRYYGLRLYGEPQTNELIEGRNINVNFTGSLRDIQLEAKNKYMENINNNYGGGIICLKCGQGKTVLALNILSEIKKKTLVIVHKEFLANQWIERINQYLPNTKIGKIQGKKFDIENKDICIGMLQTISLREFDKDAFNSFGLVIIDEVHHLSSEVFSRALLKINLPYTLGLTATPDRNDGLTHVFLDFLGPIVYKYTKDIDNTNNLIVKHIKYTNDDKKYSKNELTSMGKICSSKMINNITNYIPRTEIIVSIIYYLIQNKERNIILLSDRRDHLKNIYDLINTTNNNLKIGFYVGGMKQQLLDKTANECQIILSTYCMAAEALDIPKLNCLILASPKVNIEQSIGRILRKKHEINPLVIDFEDNFGIFKAQYYKRLKFYKLNNYDVLNINVDVETTQFELHNLLSDEYYNKNNSINNKKNINKTIKVSNTKKNKTKITKLNTTNILTDSDE